LRDKARHNCAGEAPGERTHSARTARTSGAGRCPGRAAPAAGAALG